MLTSSPRACGARVRIAREIMFGRKPNEGASEGARRRAMVSASFKCHEAVGTPVFYALNRGTRRRWTRERAGHIPCTPTWGNNPGSRAMEHHCRSERRPPPRGGRVPFRSRERIAAAIQAGCIPCSRSRAQAGRTRFGLVPACVLTGTPSEFVKTAGEHAWDAISQCRSLGYCCWWQTSSRCGSMWLPKGEARGLSSPLCEPFFPAV